jgi:hypothetical protein
MRRLADIPESEALAAFQVVLDQPMQALGLAVVVGSEQALVAFAGEAPHFTDLAFSMAGPERYSALEQARRMAAELSEPSRRTALLEDRHRMRIEVGRILIFNDADAGEFEEPDNFAAGIWSTSQGHRRDPGGRPRSVEGDQQK